ncbi:lysophospholipid acyltransferase family protein [Humitalea sp. 24SJ18S-53]|uniref:lysophospholipid acyltransferase family protein n=1 Tax=Humitalea sp. 24SJ18S-53 TaxID=3422307 RepID=UPI003D66B2F5
MLKRIIRHPSVLAVGARLLGAYLALVYRTTRWSLVGAEHAAAFPEQQRPVIAAFWHERLPLMPRMWQAATARLPEGVSWPARVLVSRSRDGRFIGAIVGRFGLVMVHASTNRGGTTGLREMLRVLAGGHAVVITPDGPRGPRRVAAGGVAQLAALSGVPVLPCAAATTRRIILPSWDRMMLPLPFGRGVVVCGAPIPVARDAAATMLPVIEAALTAACDAADAWVLRP